MPFHRKTVPSYFGGLPGGYDYINNAISGTPAGADGAKSSGPNSGTYFIAFGEDATSADANRPASALSDNTDFLDNLLRRDIALPVRSGDGTGAPTATVTVTGPGVFMGLMGAALTDLFHVTDTNDEDIDVGGTKIIVSSAVDQGGSPVSVGGGFSSGNVLLTFNISIPTAQTYRIYYGQRTNFATFPADGLTTTRVRNLTEVDYQVEELFRLLHGNGLNWNDAWTSTIWDLAKRGLNEMYSLSTTGGSGALNTAGAGAVATRSAAPLTMRSALADRSQVNFLNALWEADATADAALPSNSGYGAVGSAGFVTYGQRWTVGGELPAAPVTAAFMNLARRPLPLAAPSVGLGYWTRIDNTATATISSGGGPAGLYTITLDSGSNTYFWLLDTVASPNVKRSAMAMGRDFLLLTLSSGKQIAVRVMELSSSSHKAAFVTAPDGGPVTEFASLPVSVTNVEWASPTFSVGTGAMASKQQFLSNPLSLSTALYADDGIFAVIPPPATDPNSDPSTPVDYAQYNGPAVSAHYLGRDTTLVDGNRILGWGAYGQNSTAGVGATWQELAYLTSDGGLHAGYMQQVYTAVASMDVPSTGNQKIFSGTVAALNLDLDHFDTFFVALTNASGAAVEVTWTSQQTALNNPGAFPLLPGRKIRIVILQATAGSAFSALGLLNGDSLATVTYEQPWGIAVPPLQGIAGAIDIYELEVFPTTVVLGKVTRF